MENLVALGDRHAPLPALGKPFESDGAHHRLCLLCTNRAGETSPYALKLWKSSPTANNCLHLANAPHIRESAFG